MSVHKNDDKTLSLNGKQAIFLFMEPPLYLFFTLTMAPLPYLKLNTLASRSVNFLTHNVLALFYLTTKFFSINVFCLLQLPNIQQPRCLLTSKASSPVTREENEIFGIPIIIKMHIDSPFWKGFKNKLHSSACVVSLHHNEPITVARCRKYLSHLHDTNILQS